MNSADLKRQHEKAVADELLRSLGVEPPFERLGNDKDEPDVLYKQGARTLGIEVADAYYDNSDARQNWEHARGNRQMPPEGYEFRDGGILVNPDVLICKKIQSELDDKCMKQYQGADEVWLCINQQAELSDANSVKKCVQTLKIPSGHHFARIYLFYLSPLHDGGRYTAVRLA